MIPPPTNIRYNSDSKILSWNAVPEADSYEIQFHNSISTVWEIAYIGENTECSFEHVSGTYAVQGRSKSGPDWGVYGPEVEIIIS